MLQSNFHLDGDSLRNFFKEKLKLLENEIQP